jgi:DNA-binding NarL/FixJ family response regulator
VEPEIERIRVLVADDEERFRRVVFALLQDEPDIEVVGHASDGAEAVAIAQDLVPDLVLLDVRMPGMHGIEAATVIRRLLPTTKVVMLTASEEEDDVFEALKAGAGGYILKEGLVTDLAQAVRVVAQDLGLLLSPSIASKVLVEFKDPPRRAGRRSPSGSWRSSAWSARASPTTRSPTSCTSPATRSSATWPTSWPSCTSAPASTR